MPIGIAGNLLGVCVLPESPLRRDLRFDLWGFLVLGVGVALLLYGTSNFAYDGWGDIATVSGPIILAVLLLLLYIPVDLLMRESLLDLRLFAERNFWAGNLLAWLGTVGLFGASFLLPQYLQTLRGLDPYPAGLRLLPMGLAALVSTVVVGRLYNRLDGSACQPKVQLCSAGATRYDAVRGGQAVERTGALDEAIGGSTRCQIIGCRRRVPGRHGWCGPRHRVARWGRCRRPSCHRLPSG